MEGSQPGKGIDPQMVRDHGGDLEVLEREIRKVDLEFLSLQAHLAQVRPLPTQGSRRRQPRHGR
jgi:hypothetical protein